MTCRLIDTASHAHITENTGAVFGRLWGEGDEAPPAITGSGLQMAVQPLLGVVAAKLEVSLPPRHGKRAELLHQCAM